MADNVAITAGTGTTIAADDISGVLHQRVKISQGADGSATDVSSAAPLQVTLANTGANATPVVVDLGANNDVTVTGTITANLSAVDNAVLDDIALDTEAIKTAVQTIDNAISGNEMQVDVLSMPTVAVTQSGTWDEVGINDSGNSITVDYATTGSGTATGALRVELPTNGTGVIATVGAVTAITNALPAGTNAIGKLSANSGVDIGDVDILSIAAGTNSIGNVGSVPRTTGGLTTYHLISAAATNATVVKSSAGQLFGWYIYNANASARKIAFHNTASTPTAGSSVFFSLVIPGSSGANIINPMGIAFSSGIAITTVTEVADAGTTAVASGDLAINLFYA